MSLNSTHPAAGPTAARPADRGSRRLSLALLFAAGLLAALLALLGGAGFAQAGAFVVTKTADTADGACDADCSLREAIGAANDSPGADIITVPAGTYALTLDILRITGPTTINGAGASVTVIDGASQFAFPTLTIDGQEGAPIAVTVAGLTLQRGAGNIIANYANLVVSQAKVISSTSAAGIFINVGTLALQASTVAWNTSPYNGGGILASGASVTVTDSSIVSNTAAQGAGITFWGDGPSLTILRSTISHNTAIGSHIGRDGGGVYATGGVFTLRDSTITWNTSARLGAGLSLMGVTDLDIAGSTIAYNTAENSGGGVYFEQGQPLPTTLKITGTQIISNTAGVNGGGIFVQQYYYVAAPLTATLTNSSIVSNTAGWGAGGIYFSGDNATYPASLAVQNSSVAGNGANSGSAGGIWFSGHGRLLVSASEIARNSAPVGFGGGIEFQGDGAGYLQIENSVIERNVALSGGGLNANVGPGSYVAHTIIRANQAIASTDNQAGYGGGVYGDLNLSQVTLRGNTAARDGGGIYGGGSAQITDSLIAGNTASGNGGGLARPGTLLRTTVSGNHAANGGGVSADTAIEIVASTISANQAITDGGGIYVPYAYRGGPIVTVRNSTLSGNSAGRSGGAFSDRGGWSVSGRFISRAHFHSTSIIGNTAPAGSGGGLYHTGHYGDEEGPQVLTLEDTLLADNTGGNCGGAISAEGFTSQGHNLSSDGNCPALTQTSDLKKIAAKVGPLQDNGGPTLTHALLDGSPAIDAGGAANCPAADQRGIRRPQGAACDIGAFEWQPTTPYLHVAPAGLTFIAVAGALPPPPQPFTITNTGLGALAWTATETTPWLSVSPPSGAAPASPQVTVNQAGLPVGVYTGTVTVAAAGAGDSPQTVAVTLHVIRVADVIGNWDFEQGRVAWTESSTTMWNLIRPAAELPAPITPHGGNWAALLGVNDGEVSDLAQPIALPAGVSLTLSFHYYATSPETDCTYDTVEVRLDDQVVDRIGLCQASNTNGWQQRTVALGQSPAARLPILHFRVANDPSSDPSTFALDDVRLGIPPPVYDNFIYLPAIVR